MNTQEIEETQARMKPGPAKRPSPYVETCVSFHRDDRKLLDELVQSEGRSRSDLIREAVRRTWGKKRGRQ